VSIERLPSGKYRAVVRHRGEKRASEAVDSVAEAKIRGFVITATKT
jgi:hypothetical protein